MRPAYLLLFVSILLLPGCGTMKPEDFSGGKPELDLFEYFAGRSRAWGLFEDRFGKVRRQFHVDILGRVEGDLLTLEEDFEYDDGERERRVWTIERIAENAYRGRAADVIGEASGRASGNALNWSYNMNLKVGESTWKVAFDDWMFLQPDGVMINRAHVKRFGFDIGTVTIFFQKL